jgi:hypothetical protein
MRDDNQNDTMPSDLAEAIDLLRETPPVRREWRSELLRRAEAQTATTPVRRLSLSVPWALAAGLACALAGAGAVTLLRTSRAPAPIASTEQTAVAGTVMLPVRFSLNAPNAAQVSIVGDFNDWNPTTLPMRRSADGRVWEVEVRLPLGRYTYSFMVDGRLARDPEAPSTTDDGFGTPNSVLMVRGS